MKTAYAAVTLFTVIVVGAQAAADRRWQTGTWTQVGVGRTPFVGDVVHERMPPGFNKPEMTEVATYVIESDDRRYYLQAMVAIGSDGFDLHVTVGNSVTFAVERRTAYIKLDKDEYRLLVVKNERKKAP
ncbi:MAG TPA: hypothetical protein VI485_04940 [Vicinamibacterales bacterium]|nr:hypothetical protein [Vicinamibacterales bacterium]